MNEALAEAVTRRVAALLPPALLVGRRPPVFLGFRYVSEKPYGAVVIGSLTPGELLGFSNEAALAALLDGTPVYLYAPGLPGGGESPGLSARLARARRELQGWGVVFIKSPPRPLIDAAAARRLQAQGLPAPRRARYTPLATDILSAPRENP